MKGSFCKVFGICALIALAGFSSPAFAGVISEVRYAISRNDLGGADQLLASYRARHGIDPEYLEALSWMGRGALSAGDLGRADEYAAKTQSLTLELLKRMDLDSNPHLALALGAALEVQAQALARQNQTGKAISLLRTALDAYGDTSIRARLQKNLNLLTLVGKIAPPLEFKEYLGPEPRPIAEMKGSVVLIFFWAHWCGDCKAQAPIIARLRSDFSGEKLVVIAPTQRYGFAGTQEKISPAQEKAYIDTVRRSYYARLSDVPAPLSKENFDLYGASTTPTIVLVAPSGHIALYHPGGMTYEELRTEIAGLLQSN